MSRERKIVTVPEFPGTRNRDLGKLFLLTEWPAAVGEKWAIRMMLAYNRSGGEIPMEVQGVGIEGVAIIGLNAFLRGNANADEVVPLLDQLLECVQSVRDPGRPDIATAFVDNDTDEIMTRLWLRAEVLSLHIHFPVVAALSALARKIMEKLPPSPASSSA